MKDLCCHLGPTRMDYDLIGFEAGPWRKGLFKNPQ